MATLTATKPSTVTGNTVTINYTTDVTITNIELTKDGITYIQPTTFSQTSATFNVNGWANGTYSTCYLRASYTDSAPTTIPCTNITLSRTSLEFTSFSPVTLNTTLTPSNTTDAITWSTTSSSVAGVSNGVVTPISNGYCTIKAICGTKSASCNVTVNINSSSPSSQYIITNDLANVINSNTATSISSGKSYSAKLTAKTGFTISYVKITVGGIDVTDTCYASGINSIYISSGTITGNIIIIAIAS